MLCDYKEEPMRTSLEMMTDTGYLGVKRNFSSRSQRRDAEELNVCGVVYGYIVSTDSYLFTESNLKQLLQTGLMPVPPGWIQRASVSWRIYLLLPAVFPRELTLLRILFTICPLCQPCACESLLPIYDLFPLISQGI